MLIEPLLQLLAKLKLHGMLGALQRQLNDPDAGALRFEERLGLLLQHELAERDNHRLTQRLRIATLPQPACLEDLDTHFPRDLDPALLSTVRDLGWIGRRLNVLITGPTGIGKSFIAAALAHAACRADYCVRCFRLPRLLDELARAHAFQRRSSFLRSLAKADLLLIDDFAISWKSSMTATTSRPRSSPPSSTSSNGMPIWMTLRSPMPSWIALFTTPITSTWAASRSASSRRSARKTPKTRVPALPARSRSPLLGRYRNSLCYPSAKKPRTPPIRLLASGYPPARAHGLRCARARARG